MYNGKLLLVIDIGNTHTVAGLSNYADLALTLNRPKLCVRFRTDSAATADEYRALVFELFLRKSSEVQLDFEKISQVVVSSVVPQLEPTVREAFSNRQFCEGTTQVTFINSNTPRQFKLNLPFPEQLGADRLANVAGALELYPAPFLIVDAGTATTFCYVDSNRTYQGGAISPGLEISFKALASRAAKLFSVEWKHPAQVLGNTTESQLQSGLLFGYEAFIEGMVDRMLNEIADRNSQTYSNSVKLIATGGCVQPLSLSSRFTIEADLTLIGLMSYAKKMAQIA